MRLTMDFGAGGAEEQSIVSDNRYSQVRTSRRGIRTGMVDVILN